MSVELFLPSHLLVILFSVFSLLIEISNGKKKLFFGFGSKFPVNLKLNLLFSRTQPHSYFSWTSTSNSPHL